MKVLITGCRGQLGLELARQIAEAREEIEVIETDIHNLDITDQGEVFRLVHAEKPDVIINCAAYTNVDACEKDETAAMRANGIGPLNLSAAAYSIGSKIIQVSTDYVFDGDGSVPRKEMDPINPQTCYGRSKVLGEKLVRETNPRHYIVRTAWLYGEGNNFVRTVLRLADEQKELNIVDDQFGSPTSTVDLAQCLLSLMKTESYGTYHATCEGCCSWYEFAKKILELRSIDMPVNRISSMQLNRPAKRPKYSVLENYMLKLICLNSFRHWEAALEEYLKGGDYR